MIVLKIGGDIFERGLDSRLTEDIKQVIKTDELVIAHGGGDEVTRISERLGKKQIFVSSPDGIRSRYTDRETVEIYTMVMAGKINKEIVAFLLSENIPALGLSGIDGALITAVRKKHLIIKDERGRKRVIDGGFTGKISKVNSELLKLLIKGGYVPVVAPAAIGEEYEPLNVDSDRAAAYIAGELGAQKIIFLTDVEGIFLEEKKIKHLSVKEAESLLPKIGSGMDKKVIASIEAVKAGVGEAIISSGFIENPLFNSINHRTGTVIKLE